MKGDFSRDTFAPLSHFSRVLMQQGRVQVDSDWNEQTAILLHHIRALAGVLIGPHGGPAKADGTAGDAFKIAPFMDANNRQVANDFAIGQGLYFVNGVLCENNGTDAHYAAQADNPLSGDAKFETASYLVYLDVWERHLSYLEIEDSDGSQISIREVALNGCDTATRAKIVWQVKTKKTDYKLGDLKPDDPKTYPAFLAFLGDDRCPGTGLLKAQAIQPAGSGSADPCPIPSDSRYRGPENQLYRVEVHKPGTAEKGATFKWSRENGAVIFPIRQLADKTVTLENLGRDARLGLKVGDWVEIIDDDYTLQNRAEPLLQINAIDYETNTITLDNGPASTVGRTLAKHPLLRRWDQHKTEMNNPSKDGVAIEESGSEWIELEDGIQVQFQPGQAGQPRQYCTADYWLIPARTATGDVEWPGPVGAPDAIAPRGIIHYYAPLWLISMDANGAAKVDSGGDLRRTIKPLA